MANIIITALVSAALAQVTSVAPVIQPGLLPGSPFYRLDLAGEAIERLLAFSPQDKLRVDMKSVRERTAEMNAIIKTVGEESSNLDIVKEGLDDALDQSHSDIEDAQTDGKDMESEIESIDAEIEHIHNEFASTFDDRKAKIETEIEKVKADLETERVGNDDNAVAETEKKLSDLEKKQTTINSKNDHIEEIFTRNQGKIRLRAVNAYQTRKHLEETTHDLENLQEKATELAKSSSTTAAEKVLARITQKMNREQAKA